MSRKLTEGVEYYFDRLKKDRGIYVGYDEDEEIYLFKPTYGFTYEQNEEGLIPFYAINDYYIPYLKNK